MTAPRCLLSSGYLAYLTRIERSPNTVKAYAHDLKGWFVFLGGQDLDWREVRLENVAEFVAWLRRPPDLRDETVPVLPSVEHHCSEATVNRKLSALSAFHQHANSAARRHGTHLHRTVSGDKTGPPGSLTSLAVPMLLNPGLGYRLRLRQTEEMTEVRPAPTSPGAALRWAIKTHTSCGPKIKPGAWPARSTRRSSSPSDVPSKRPKL